MIEYRKGDLFVDRPKFIVHGCNARGVMGAGFAKQIRARFPVVYNDYKHYCELREPDYLLGTNRICIENGVTVVNCIIQMDYGTDGKRYVSYDAVDDCMSKLSKIKPPSVDTISMPKIGCGLGGGEWSIIETIINHNLKDCNVIVYEL